VNTYLSPLDNGSRYDATLRETLRAYFDAGRSASAACHTLNVSRRTIRNRMARIKQRLGPLLNERQAELELALQLDELKQRQVTQ
jgi:DNA-binding PucR family transcriptional regulator